jgi:hypothetical protein
MHFRRKIEVENQIFGTLKNLSAKITHFLQDAEKIKSAYYII